VQPRQTGRIPPIRLDPIAARFGISDGATKRIRARAPTSDVGCHSRTGLLHNRTEARRPRAELAHQAIQGPRRVGNPAIFPDLAAQATHRHRDDNAFLVNIKPT